MKEELNGRTPEPEKTPVTRKRTMSQSMASSRSRAGSILMLPSLNRNLLPLKFTLFFFNGASFAIMPYLTIHMKDIGINDVDIALMYAILPFCVFIAPPVVGFFADKLGNYIRVLLMSIIGCAFFHSLLLAVPTNLRHVDYPETTMTMTETDVSLKWKPCDAEKACTKIRLVSCEIITNLCMSITFCKSGKVVFGPCQDDPDHSIFRAPISTSLIEDYFQESRGEGEGPNPDIF